MPRPKRYTPCPRTTREPVGRRGLLELHCSLPTGHQALEHYDSMLSRVWVHPDDARPGFIETRTVGRMPA